jgi:hypothetical protein
MWNKEERPDQWKESIIVPIHKTGDKTVCKNYHGLSLLSNSYKILPNMLLSRLRPNVDDIIGEHRLLSKNVKVRIYNIIILPVVLYRCETWSLKVREEHKLRVFENRVLRRIFGPKRDGVME